MIDNYLQELINHRKIDLSKISRDYHRYPLFRLRRNVYGKTQTGRFEFAG